MYFPNDFPPSYFHTYIYVEFMTKSMCENADDQTILFRLGLLVLSPVAPPHTDVLAMKAKRLQAG